MAHPVDRVVDRGILFDGGVGVGEVGLRLVIIVIADEILDRIVGKEAAKLAVKLGGKRLVRRNDEHRFLHQLDHVGDGVGLSRAAVKWKAFEFLLVFIKSLHNIHYQKLL